MHFNLVPYAKDLNKYIKKVAKNSCLLKGSQDFLQWKKHCICKWFKNLFMVPFVSPFSNFLNLSHAKQQSGWYSFFSAGFEFIWLQRTVTGQRFEIWAVTVLWRDLLLPLCALQGTRCAGALCPFPAFPEVIGRAVWSWTRRRSSAPRPAGGALARWEQVSLHQSSSDHVLCQSVLFSQFGSRFDPRSIYFALSGPRSHLYDCAVHIAFSDCFLLLPVGSALLQLTSGLLLLRNRRVVFFPSPCISGQIEGHSHLQGTGPSVCLSILLFYMT